MITITMMPPTTKVVVPPGMFPATADKSAAPDIFVLFLLTDTAQN